MKVFSKSEEPMEVHRSHEYGSTIIHSIVTGTPSVVYGNMPNRGAIGNLPYNAIAEVPTLVDRSGLRFTTVGDIPTELAAYMQPHIVQHELFIQAAMTGRRDHVYQAAMFDPLTSATLTTDKIVEMCDELIAAHGDLLPPLNAPSRVPTSGKKFGLVEPKDLRASWDAAQAEKSADYIHEWLVIGPFDSLRADFVSIDQVTEFEKSLETFGSALDFSVDYISAGRQIKWRSATADKSGFVDLSRVIGKKNYAIGYAYAEIESIHARETVLSCGSDDGIKIWMNGTLVHSIDVRRPHKPAEDSKHVYLNAGTNRLLIKISNYDGAWGFSVAVPKSNF